mgnify:CR=1 FL=1
MPGRDPPAREPRTLALAAGPLDYTLVRRRGRRGVGLKVDASGLTVSAPLSVPLARVEKVVRESESWVLGKLAVWRERQVPVQRWEDGATLPWLGESLVLRLDEGRRAFAQLDGAALRVTVPAFAEEPVRKARSAPSSPRGSRSCRRRASCSRRPTRAGEAATAAARCGSRGAWPRPGRRSSTTSSATSSRTCGT